MITNAFSTLIILNHSTFTITLTNRIFSMSKLFKSLLFNCCFLAYSAGLNAQSYADPALSAEVLNNPSYQLYVVVQKPVDANELRPFKKNPGLDKQYYTAMDSLNKNWKDAVSAHWKLHKKPQYVSVDELLQLQKSMSKEERAKVLVLAYSNVEERIRSELEERVIRKLPLVFKANETSLYYEARTDVGLYHLERLKKVAIAADNNYYRSLSETWKECIIPVSCVTYQIANWYPGYSDLAFALVNMQECITQRAADKKAKTSKKDIAPKQIKLLEGKTLLIPEAFTQIWKKDELKVDVPESEITKNYPFPARVVRQEEIDRVMRAQDKKYAVLVRTYWPRVWDSGPKGMYYWAIDAGDGKTILSYTDEESPMIKDRYTYAFRNSFFDKRARDIANEE